MRRRRRCVPAASTAYPAQMFSAWRRETRERSLTERACATACATDRRTAWLTAFHSTHALRVACTVQVSGAGERGNRTAYAKGAVRHSKLRESMILRPRLPYRLVAYFSVGYARYKGRRSSGVRTPMDAWSALLRAALLLGFRQAQLWSRRPGVPPISSAIPAMHSSSRGAARVISQSRGHWCAEPPQLTA
jgi:hypothetical protein